MREDEGRMKDIFVSCPNANIYEVEDVVLSTQASAISLLVYTPFIVFLHAVRYKRSLN